MLSTAIAAINSWPAILQGALGSALFAFCLWACKKVAGRGLKAGRSFSLRARRSALRDRLIFLAARVEQDAAKQQLWMSGLLYRALRNVVNGLLWITVGLWLGSFISVFAAVGYLGGIYYLLKAAAFLAPDSHENKNHAAELEKTEAELHEVEEKLHDQSGSR